VRDVSWTGAISRVAALKAAGFTVEHLGDTVCSIDGDGCPASDCWCSTNWWWSGQWDTNAKDWDPVWPAPNLVNGDVIGFHNDPATPAWVPPALPAPSYVGGWKAVEWLRPRQVTDTGSYGNVGSTVETIFAVTANKWDAGQWRRQADSPSMLHYTYGSGASYVTGGGQAGKMAVGLAAAGGCWPVNATKVTAYYDPVTGQYAPQAVNHSWAMLGMKAMNQTIPASATQALKHMMTANGGWGWPGFGDDTDTTAVAVQALVAAGESVTSSHVVSGMTYIKAHQNSDGGFNPHWSPDTSNASTAAAVEAILTVGESPIAGRWVVTPSNPISYLVNTQQADGSFLYGGSGNELETRQAAVAMLGAWFPVYTAAVNDCYGLSGQVYAGPVPLDSVAVSGSDPLTDVTVTAEGWNNAGIQSTNDATGAYTLSVPATGDYTVTPSKAAYVFSPTSRAVSVSGSPGDVTQVGDFAGEIHYRNYMPMLMRQN
jgi:hypothetical protein